MARETLVTVNQLTRYFDEHCAVSNLSFTVARGEILGFLGPNGAGKSTTMRMITGVLAASSGNVSIAGHDIVDEPVQAKQHIGFLPEQPPLYPDQTVDEYLSYCARLRKIPTAKLNSAVANSKQRCGLEKVGSRLIGNLSKGYQQRIGIAQAIIHSPAIVILDEPTIGLDPNQIVEIRKLICELGDDHSVILSTHVLPEVQTTCDRVVIINNGTLVLDENLSALNSENRLNNFTVALREPPLPEELQMISGVINVEPVDKHRFRISYINDQNIPGQLAQAAAASGWGLFELVPQRDTLEEVFIKLTRGETDNE